MNDGRYKAFDDEAFRVFSGGYEHIVKQMRDGIPGVRITVIEPSPYDDVTRANATDPANAQKIVPDRVHPHRSGHLLVAASLLEAWGATEGPCPASRSNKRHELGPFAILANFVHREHMVVHHDVDSRRDYARGQKTLGQVLQSVARFET